MLEIDVEKLKNFTIKDLEAIGFKASYLNLCQEGATVLVGNFKKKAPIKLMFTEIVNDIYRIRIFQNNVDITCIDIGMLIYRHYTEMQIDTMTTNQLFEFDVLDEKEKENLMNIPLDKLNDSVRN